MSGSMAEAILSRASQGRQFMTPGLSSLRLCVRGSIGRVAQK